ncbi:STM3941 family protein [Micromonospora sp. NPDC049497]|uniref:STM3941 family protein n=1 Tax=Micromonospora sp. NPDC049497 TaxID=3364273 RepID=UPI00378C8511
MKTVRVYAPRSKLLLLLLASAAFVLASLWIIDASRGFLGILTGVVGIAFFGLGGVYFFLELVYRRPTLQIDAEGITDRASLASAGRLDWPEIGTVKIHSVAGQRMLAIMVHDPNAVITRAGLVRRAFLRMNLATGFPPVNVPESALPYSLEALVDEMRRHNPDVQVSTD